MITFEQIQKANEGLTSIDLKNKAYVLVPERVKAFRKLFPEGFITTELLSLEAGVCVMKTEVGYYDGDRRVVLGTGMAYEKEANGYVNKTSYIENCETSAVGRALGFLALGMMLPGMMAGWLQETIGYQHFFIWTILCCLVTFAICAFLKIDPEFGKKKQ